MGQEHTIISDVCGRGSHSGGPIAEDFIGGETVSLEGDALAGVVSQVFGKPWEKLSTKTVSLWLLLRCIDES